MMGCMTASSAGQFPDFPFQTEPAVQNSTVAESPMAIGNKG
jgi:hypothetical protein